MAVFVADEQQERAVDLDRVRRLAGHVLASQRVPEAMEVNVICIAREAMAELNRHHLGADGPTDVLAFPMDLPGETTGGGPAILGDVIVCPDVAAEQASAQGATLDDEVDLLLVHGILHLLGHDHAEPGERDAMFALTGEILAGFRAADPRGSGGAAP